MVQHGQTDMTLALQSLSGVLTTDSTAYNRHLTAEGGANTTGGQVGNGTSRRSNDQLEAIGYRGHWWCHAPWRLG